MEFLGLDAVWWGVIVATAGVLARVVGWFIRSRNHRGAISRNQSVTSTSDTDRGSASTHIVGDGNVVNLSSSKCDDANTREPLVPELIALLKKTLDKVPEQLSPNQTVDIPSRYDEAKKVIDEKTDEVARFNLGYLLKVGHVELTRCKYASAENYYSVCLNEAG